MDQYIKLKGLMRRCLFVVVGIAMPALAQVSQAELDRRCELAREKAIAPLREAAIAECKMGRRNDPEWCERFYADYGDGGRTVNGGFRPRLFDDLPECVAALEARNKRRRR